MEDFEENKFADEVKSVDIAIKSEQSSDVSIWKLYKTLRQLILHCC